MVYRETFRVMLLELHAAGILEMLRFRVRQHVRFEGIVCKVSKVF